MKNFRYKIFVFVLAIVLGIVVSMQIQALRKNQLFLANDPLRSSNYYSQQYNKLNEEKQALERQLQDYEEQLGRINATLNDSDSNYEFLQEEIEHYKLIGGFTDVSGPGIIINYDIPDEKINSLGTFYLQLVNLLNELNSSGAEAVSINNERIISTSEIRMAGNAVVINGKEYHPPLTVKVIGDKQTLNNALILRFGFVENTRNRGFIIEVKPEDEIVINQYDGKPSFEYAKKYLK